MKNKKLKNLLVQSEVFYAIKNDSNNEFIMANWLDKSSVWTKEISSCKQFNSYDEAMEYRNFNNILGTDIVLVNMTCACLGRAFE